MVIIMKPGTTQERIDALAHELEVKGLRVGITNGVGCSILGLVGDTTNLDADDLMLHEGVERVMRVQEPYKKANRKFHPEDSVVEVAGHKIGGGHFQIIAGPCSVESEEQIISIAREVAAAGATMLRGGAFKPRTSPYAFQGLRAEGLELLLKAKKETGMPIVTEIMDLSHIDLFADVDLIQVGARNMQNFELLKELGHSDKPILLKRGLASTMQELLMSAEYIMAGGNENVILCERGIRTFETYTRNTMDVSAIPLLHEKTHLPIIGDPSHAAGISRMVEPLSLACTAAGADGLMIEVHNDPAHALCDGPQALRPDAFAKVVEKVKKVRTALDLGNAAE